MRVSLLLLIAIIVFGCKNNQDKKPALKTVPTSTDYQKGEKLFFSNIKKDSAFYYFTNVTETAKDSLLIAMAYSYMAMMQDDAGDFFGCQESALEGLRHLSEKNPEHYYCLSSIYNELGVSSAALKNYDAAIDYYDLALKFQQDETYTVIFQNNKAVSYQKKGDYTKAIEILDALMEKQKVKKLGYARALTNLANAKWLNNPDFYPVPDFLESLAIRIKEKNDLGVASSYNHLSDYYLTQNPDSALLYARNMFKLSASVNSSEQKIDALRKLISLETNSQSKSYFQQYQYLSDSIINARNEAKNQFALIKYHSEKNKADNLSLQKENAQKKLQILQQWIWMTGVISVVIIVLIFFLWWSGKKRRQIEWESKMAIQHSLLKTSQKVHDTVANRLYRLMKEIEHNEQFDKEQTLDIIEQIYERTRDISYDTAGQEPGNNENIADMLSSFGTSNVKVFIAGNDDKIWEAVSVYAKTELYKVLEELMINMVKHSNAGNVVIKFSLSDDTLMIVYRDDGVGFPADIKYGNGLKSTETRIRKIKGDLTFMKESGAGALVKIIIPIYNV